MTMGDSDLNFSTAASAGELGVCPPLWSRIKISLQLLNALL